MFALTAATGICARLLLILSLALTLFASSQVLAQVPGAPGAPAPPPKEEPPKPGTGGSTTGGGVGVGVDVNVGGLIKKIIKRHTKVHLQASSQKAQAGEPILFTTTVAPQATGLSYEFHWTTSGPGYQADVPNINYAYPAPGEYNASVIVYQNGKKLATSNEVKVTIEGLMVAVNPPPTSPPTTTATEPTANTTADQTPPPAAPTLATPTPATPPPATPTAIGTPSSTPPPFARPRPVKAAKPPEPDVSARQVKVLPDVAPPPVSYSLAFRGEVHPQSGKPANFHAELTPGLPPGKQIRYCFHWGDGGPPSCQADPSAVHTYQTHGKYLAAVEAELVVEGQAVAHEQKLAASDPLMIEAKKPFWSSVLPSLIVLLVVLVAGYGVHRARKFLRGNVTAQPDFGRHSVSTQNLSSGTTLRIRCVQSAVTSQVTFLSPGEKKEAARA